MCEDLPYLGRCCACLEEGTEGNPVRNLMMLDRLAPTPGTGWGCFVCGLPLDGAVAVLCERCVEAEADGSGFGVAGSVRRDDGLDTT